MMQSAIQSMWLLAARQDLHRVWGRFDHERPGFGTSHIVTVAAALALLIAMALIWRRMARRSAREYSCDSRGRLFRELCGAHRLSRASRRLLKRLASARGVANPAMLFIEPAYLDATNLPAQLRSSTAELQMLREALFGDA